MGVHALLAAWTTLSVVHSSLACPLHEVSAAHQEPPYLNHRSVPMNNDTKRTALQDVRVFDGSRFSTPQTICLDGGYIVNDHSCANAEARVNATGKFLIPGLVDSHIHLTDVQSLENFTSYGCTTAFHMNCRNYTQCATMAHQPGLASFYFAGRSAVGNGSAHEAQDPTRPKDTLIYPDTNVVQFTQFQFRNGSDFHKITAEVNGPSTQQQTQMVRTAHAQFQRQTMTHASAIDSYDQAIASGTDGIQHVPDDGLLRAAAIRQIAQQAQFVTPTLNVFEYAYTDPVIASYFNTAASTNRTLAHAEENARQLYRAGIPLVVGTDASGTLSVGNQSFTVPYGSTVHYELQHFVNILGMSPAEAINAATREPAKWHRVPDRGVVEVGKRADLVLLGSDPLLNISNTLDIERVWVLGREVSKIARPGQQS